jgi:hypothetical protein
MVREDPEAFLRALVAPLSRARRGQPLPGVPTGDTGTEHRGMPGSGGGSPEGSREFWFWPPVPPAAKRIRVTVSTLWEAAWAELDIPGRAG